MALEEMRGGDESARPQLERRSERFTACCAKSITSFRRLFERYDEATIRASRCRESAACLNRRQYIPNLMREVEKELNVHVSN